MKVKKLICILGLFSLFFTSSALAGKWTQLTPETSPLATSHHALAYLGDDLVLCFGGLYGEDFTSAISNPTWIYEDEYKNWEDVFLLTAPASRRHIDMAFLGNNSVLLFGGSVWPGDILSGETWIFNLNDETWTLLEPDTSPSPRAGFGMATIGGGKAVLFGGSYPLSGETWVFDSSSNNWTLMSPATAPSARSSHAMSSLGGDRVLIFGGVSASGLNNDTWMYDYSDNTWTELKPPTAPSARSMHEMAWLEGDQVLLFGGAPDPSGETWIYDLSDNTWTKQTLSTAPSPRDGHGMTSMSGGRVLLFGGATPYRNNETWIYEPVSLVDADIDIAFCANPNSFNCKQKGVLPVTIFGSADLDVAAIQIDTVKVCLASDPDNCKSAVDAQFPEDRGNPSSDLGTTECVGGLANPDGFDDLDVLFIAREVAALVDCASIARKGTSPALIIKGELSDGTEFISTAVNDIGIDQLRIPNK